MVDSHPVTTQLQATTAYRYTGKNPNNYVMFNNELWRIIGIFDVDDGKGNLEQRMKLIRNESIGNIAWSGNGVSDWLNATGMKLLNEGDYWNRTGTYSSTGLTKEAKNMIADAKWYLGSKDDYGTASTGLASHFYSDERATTLSISAGKPTDCIGKVGLMYASDYGYATGGGSTTNRVNCLKNILYNWSDSSVSDCRNNDWLYDSNNNQWTLTPEISNKAFFVTIYGIIYGSSKSSSVSNNYAFRPCVYLSPDISIIDGTGIQSNPYMLSK